MAFPPALGEVFPRGPVAEHPLAQVGVCPLVLGEAVLLVLEVAFPPALGEVSPPALEVAFPPALGEVSPPALEVDYLRVPPRITATYHQERCTWSIC